MGVKITKNVADTAAEVKSAAGPKVKVKKEKKVKALVSADRVWKYQTPTYTGKLGNECNGRNKAWLMWSTGAQGTDGDYAEGIYASPMQRWLGFYLGASRDACQNLLKALGSGFDRITPQNSGHQSGSGRNNPFKMKKGIGKVPDGRGTHGEIPELTAAQAAELEGLFRKANPNWGAEAATDE